MYYIDPLQKIITLKENCKLSILAKFTTFPFLASFMVELPICPLALVSMVF